MTIPSTNGKIKKLAETIRMAGRIYDSGKRDSALKILSSAASKVRTLEERNQLNSILEADMKRMPIRVYYQSILLGKGGTAVK